MTGQSAPSPGAETLEEAARWFVLLASGEATEADRQRWQLWRAADAGHEAAWHRAEKVTARFAKIPGEQASLSLDALEQRPTRGRRQVLGGLAGLFLVGLTGWQGWRHTDASADEVTAVGEQRGITLPDGSQLTLDTDTAVDIAFSGRERLVRLRRGRVSITTAKPARPSSPGLPPFWVETAEGRIRALGTRFSVRQESASTHVAVLEARVAVHPGALNTVGGVVTMKAGEAARFNRGGLIERRTAQPADGAWPRGMLVADDMALADFVAELARYRQTPLDWDPAVADLRISGTYPLADTDRVLAALSRTLPVRAVPRQAGAPAEGMVVVRVP